MSFRTNPNRSVGQYSNSDFSLSTQQQPNVGSVGVSSSNVTQTQKFSSDFFLLPLLFAGCTPAPNSDIAENYDLKPRYVSGDIATYKVKTDHKTTLHIKTAQGQILTATVELHVGDLVRFSKYGTFGSSSISYIESSEGNAVVTFSGREFVGVQHVVLEEFGDGAYSRGYFTIQETKYSGFKYFLKTGERIPYDNTPCCVGLLCQCPQ